jgi:hypothetical protein
LDGDTWTILILVLVERRAQWWRVLELCRDLFGGVLYLDDDRETYSDSAVSIGTRHPRMSAELGFVRRSRVVCKQCD